MGKFDRTTHFIGRLLLAVLFLGGAVQKVADPGPAMALLSKNAMPVALVWPALVFNALAGVLLIAGVALRPLGLALAGYCLVTSCFHLIPNDPWQMSILVKNWAIAGGCLILATHRDPTPT